MSEKDTEAIISILIEHFKDVEARALETKRQLADLSLTNHTKPTCDPDGMKWEQVVGAKGPFEIARDVDNGNFKALREDLEKHKGHRTIGNDFFWLFPEKDAIGRKPKAPAGAK